ncbi:MAG: HAD family hydrolase [Bdellovibrionales bacterium]
MKHWIFDLDGTLVDTIETYFEKIRRVFAHFDVSYTQADLQKSCDYFDGREYFALYLEEPHVSEACSMLAALSLELAPLAQPFNGVRELLEWLQERGIHMSVWTGRDLASAQRILEHTGLRSFFSSIVSGTCVMRKKPDPEGIKKLVSHSKFGADVSLMIGDHLYDIQGARAAGVAAVSVSWLVSGAHPLETVSDFHFYTVNDLHRWARTRLESGGLP